MRFKKEQTQKIWDALPEPHEPFKTTTEIAKETGIEVKRISQEITWYIPKAMVEMVESDRKTRVRGYRKRKHLEFEERPEICMLEMQETDY